MLRIETTINNPKDFKVYRDCFRNRSIQKAWVPIISTPLPQSAMNNPLIDSSIKSLFPSTNSTAVFVLFIPSLLKMLSSFNPSYAGNSSSVVFAIKIFVFTFFLIQFPKNNFLAISPGLLVLSLSYALIISSTKFLNPDFTVSLTKASALSPPL